MKKREFILDLLVATLAGAIVSVAYYFFQNSNGFAPGGVGGLATISKESQEEIFVPFYTTKQEGTGIGLSLSRQIMRLHGGTLNLTRSDAKTTVFTLIFK